MTEFRSTVGGVLESFQYDTLGVPVEVSRQGSPTWVYGQPTFGQVPFREAVGSTQLETYVYDTHGRMTQWDTGLVGQDPDTLRSLRYDGLGRLAAFHTVDGPSGDEDLVEYRYSAGNDLYLEVRSTPNLATSWITRFSGHRHDSGSGEDLLEVLPWMRVRNGSEFLMILKDHGEEALAVLDASGAEETFEIRGVYGGELNGVTPGGLAIGLVGPAWPLDGVHGADADRERGMAHRGQRHAMLDDGRWFQPEPLLTAGLPGSALGTPSGLGPVYGGGNPVYYQDRTGRFIFLAAPAVVLAGGGASASTVAAVTLGASVGVVVGVAIVTGRVTLPTLPTSSNSPPLVQPTAPSSSAPPLTHPDSQAGPVSTPVPDASGGDVEGFDVGPSPGLPMVTASEGGETKPRFVGQPDGTLVDTESTPQGSYDQPDGGRTDILQGEDHGSGQSHTHEPITNTNPKTGETFVNGRTKPGRPVSVEDVANIESGAATPSKPKGR